MKSLLITAYVFLGVLIISALAWIGVAVLSSFVPPPNDAQKVVARYHENLVIDCISGTVIYIPVDGEEYELRCTRQ